MSKKTLIISASPRKGGNSDLLCDQFQKGAEAGGHQAEKIVLADKKINYCMGCDGCKTTGTCVWKDDMEEILVKLAEADVIVLATPVYFYSMDAQLKTFIDRNVAGYTGIRNKEFYFIATAADTSTSALDGTIHGLRGYTSCLPAAKEKGIIYGTGAWSKGDILGKPAMEQAFEMGKNI